MYLPTSLLFCNIDSSHPIIICIESDVPVFVARVRLRDMPFFSPIQFSLSNTGLISSPALDVSNVESKVSWRCQQSSNIGFLPGVSSF